MTVEEANRKPVTDLGAPGLASPMARPAGLICFLSLIKPCVMQVAALQQGTTRETPAGERDERETKESAQKLPWKVRAPEIPTLTMLTEAIVSPTPLLLAPGC